MKQTLPLYARLCAIVLGCFLFCNSAKAQFVTIPDVNFVTWLNNNGFSGCMSGNQLNTQCPAVLSATSITCGSASIHNITGIENFINLTYLDCSSNPIYTISALPPRLWQLTCNNDSLTSLPNLPGSLRTLYCNNNEITGTLTIVDSLQYLDCSYNRINNMYDFSNTLLWLVCEYNGLDSLPHLNPSLTELDCAGNFIITHLPLLPSGLTYLDCADMSLDSLPSNLPGNLFFLDCSGNQLHSLPNLPNTLQQLGCGENFLSGLPVLPSGLISLDCEYNPLYTLPTLPNGLQTLYCDIDSLSSLPGLPASLTYLQCGYNQLSQLTVPQSLTYLDCDHNQLGNLSNLPAGLKFLNCSYNQLTSLTGTPDSLGEFYCNNNPNLTCLPLLNKITNLNFTNTAVTCLPNYGTVASSTPALNLIPLCAPFNPNGCSNYWNISGMVYYDANANCVFDSNDVAQGNVKIQLYNNGVLEQQTYTGGAGYYSFYVNGVYGNYTAQIDTTQLPFTVLCPDTAYILPLFQLLIPNMPIKIMV